MNEARKLLEALRAVKRRQAEKPLTEYGNVFRFFGSWKKSVFLVYGPIVLACLWLVFSGAEQYPKATPGESGVSHHHHGAPTAAQMEEIKATIPESAIQGDYSYEDITVGSPIWDGYGRFNSHGYSYLKAGQRRDSKMVVRDDVADGRSEFEYAYGCGREWYVTDRNGAFNRTPVKRDTGCNLKLHQTGAYDSTNGHQWGPPSYHPN